MASRWDHWLIQISALFMILVIGVLGTAFIIDLFYNFWLLDREVRLIFSTVLMTAMIPYILFLLYERERSGGLDCWLWTFVVIFAFLWFWNIYHLCTVRKENGVFTSIIITLYIILILILGALLYLFILYVMWREW